MRSETESRPVLPASILVEGRSCLVVGGGKIAARKAGHLLDAGADVVVVSPAADEATMELAEAGRIRHFTRTFEDSDVDGKFLVFAATDDENVNRHVLETCKSAGVFCSAVDVNWTDSDFVTPAICRKGDLTISVSTGGRSCTRARIVKERIAEFIETMVEGDGSV